MKKTGVFVLLMLAALGAQSLHIKGGWMYYKYLGRDNNGFYQYRVNLKVYRDCAPPNPGQNDNIINFTVYNNSTGLRQGDFPAPLTANFTLAKTSFSECFNPRPQVCYVILEYETVVTLPASPNGYTIAFQRCCRINGIVNILQPSNSLGNTYTLTIPGNATDPGDPENSSPEFSQRDTLLVCLNSPIELDYSAVDTDGDSLVYYFTDALNGASQNNPLPGSSPPPPYGSLPYLPGFSADNPFGTNLRIDNRTGIITGRSPAGTGEYVIAVAVDEYRRGRKIATTRKELHVNVSSCVIAAATLPPFISSCDDFTVRFENQSPSPAILEYFWDFGVPNRVSDTSVNAVPVFTFPDTGVYRVKLIVNRTSSCSDSAFTEVRVFPGFQPSFTYDGACFLNPFNFRDATSAAYGFVNSWRWDFGNTQVLSDTSRLASPSYIYPSPGVYNASLVVGSSKGCIDSVVLPVNVFDRPSLILSPDTLICQRDGATLHAVGSGIFSWDPNPTLSNPNSANPRVTPPVGVSTYFVTLTDRGCVARDSIRVEALPFISVDAGNDTTICRGDGFALFPITRAITFDWQPGGLLNDRRLRNPIITPTDSLTTVVITANLGTCQDRDSLVIKTVPYPVASTPADRTICYADSTLLVAGMVGSSFVWTPAAQLTQPNQLVTSTRRLTRNTTFTLTVRDTLGCPKPVSSSVTVNVRPRITVQAGNDTSVVYEQPLQLNAQSNAILFNWSPSIGLSNTNIPNPIALFRQGSLPDGEQFIRYTVTASTPEGCRASDDILVRIFKTGPSVFVPSGFTPNRDGLNDLIRPILTGISRLEFFRVYNRYGQLVYETSQPGAGWDGTIKGTLQGSSAYVYQCKAVDFLGKTIIQNGTFVLVR
jgi:gliding motility-associated-like protein